jgi:phosphoglycolate phosphatase-like HAD superfamily hydrolase
MRQEHSFTAGDLSPLPWLEVVNPNIRLRCVRHALFDFDGTVSVIRRGWENIMIPMMIEMICDEHASTPDIEGEVAEYVDRSTGILTIKQMDWLEEAVYRFGLARSVKTAREYKRIYNERLLNPVHRRVSQIDGTLTSRDQFMVEGARAFLQGLYDNGVTLYLVSGTDNPYVLEEAEVLGITQYFGMRIYGALDDTEANTKEKIIQRILENHHLRGEELLVVGDGPVEIHNAKDRDAVTLGVAVDEDKRCSLNPRKRLRLLAAGVDLIVTDFLYHQELLEYLVSSRDR